MVEKYAGPLPKPTPESLPYWEGLKARRLMLPHCADCSRAHFYPRVVCPHCGSRRIEWRKASGRGKLYSFVINHRPPRHMSSGPYIIAVVELDEGPRMMTNLIGVAPDPALIRCDAPVEIHYDDVTPEVTLPRFRLVEL
jgi:uncharacterized OB-fold protein